MSELFENIGGIQVITDYKLIHEKNMLKHIKLKEAFKIRGIKLKVENRNSRKILDILYKGIQQSKID